MPSAKVGFPRCAFLKTIPPQMYIDLAFKQRKISKLTRALLVHGWVSLHTLARLVRKAAGPAQGLQPSPLGAGDTGQPPSQARGQREAGNTGLRFQFCDQETDRTGLVSFPSPLPRGISFKDPQTAKVNEGLGLF